MKAKKPVILSLIVVFILAFLLVFLNLSKGRTNFFGRASGTGVFDAANSYVFASPVVTRSGGDVIRITVFALNDVGKGMSGQQVVLTCSPVETCQGRVDINPVQPVTDGLGQAIFDVTSSVADKYIVEAEVSGKKIPQEVKVVFE